MEARIIIPTADGERLSYELRMHHGASEGLKLVLNTSEESFERWLFYLLRDVGAHIVTNDPARVRKALGLSAGDKGVVSQDTIGEVDVLRHTAKV